MMVRSYLLGDYRKYYLKERPYGNRWVYGSQINLGKYGFTPSTLDFIRMATICRSIKTARLINRMKGADIRWLCHQCGDYSARYIAQEINSRDTLPVKKNKIIASLKKLASELELGHAFRSMELWKIIKDCYKRHKDANRLSLDLPAKNWRENHLTADACDE